MPAQTAEAVIEVVAHDRASRELARVSKKMGEVAKKTDASTTAVKYLARGMVALGLGAFTVDRVLRGFVTGQEDIAQAAGKMAIAFGVVGPAAELAFKNINPTLEEIARNFIGTASDARTAWAVMATAVGDAHQVSGGHVQAALNLAQVTGMGIEAASAIIAQAILGNVRPLQEAMGDVTGRIPDLIVASEILQKAAEESITPWGKLKEAIRESFENPMDGVMGEEAGGDWKKWLWPDKIHAPDIEGKQKFIAEMKEMTDVRNAFLLSLGIDPGKMKPVQPGTDGFIGPKPKPKQPGEDGFIGPLPPPPGGGGGGGGVNEYGMDRGVGKNPAGPLWEATVEGPSGQGEPNWKEMFTMRAYNAQEVDIEAFDRFGRIPGMSIMSRIIAMAEGGIVNKPTLAMIGERGPEAVIPLTKGRGAGGATFNLNISGNLVVDTPTRQRQLVREIATVLREEGRRNNPAA